MHNEELVPSIAEVVDRFSALADDVLSKYAVMKALAVAHGEGQLDSERIAPFFRFVNDLLIDAWLLAVARLNDPVKTGKHPNLSVEAVLQHPGLDPQLSELLQPEAQRLASFGANIRDCRRKLLAHNDLSATVAGETLGAFEVGSEEPYIASLKCFTEKLCCGTGAEPFSSSSDLASNDVQMVVHILGFGLKAVDA